LIAYFLSNISANNYQNRWMFVNVIASQSSVIFRQCKNRNAGKICRHNINYDQKCK